MAELEEAVSESLKLFNVVNIKQEQKRRTTIAWLYFQRDLEIHFRTSCLYQ